MYVQFWLQISVKNYRGYKPNTWYIKAYNKYCLKTVRESNTLPHGDY